EALAQPDVLVVQEQVDELPRLALVVEQPALEAGEARVQLIDGGPQVARLHRHRGLSVTQAAQGTGDAEHGHFAYSLAQLAMPSTQGGRRRHTDTFSRNERRLGCISTCRAKPSPETTSAVLSPWPVT